MYVVTFLLGASVFEIVCYFLTDRLAHLVAAYSVLLTAVGCIILKRLRDVREQVAAVDGKFLLRAIRDRRVAARFRAEATRKLADAEKALAEARRLTANHRTRLGRNLDL